MLPDRGTTHLDGGLSIDLGAGVLAAVADVRARARLGGFAYRVVRFSTAGRQLWNKTVSARIWPKWHPSWAEVAVAPTGAISLVASHAGRPLLRTFRPSGTVAWSARIGSGIPSSQEFERHDVDAGSAGVFVAGWIYAPTASYGYGRIYRYRP